MIGTLLGNRYELLDKIGEGGMAEVYKAKCHLLNRFVAVKILKEEFIEDKEFVDKFKREATAVASLSDNNIVNIYDVGSQGDINYIVMEYVKGISLKEHIRQKGTIKTDEAIDISIQIARALDCAHKNNIIHRDVKPHNIMVTEEGLVKVTDFGIAKASNSVTLTNTGKILGSAHYFSPEQAKGNVVDCRTDIYSLGIVMYEMVTGKVPYDAESPVSVALKHIQEEVVPPKQLKNEIPESLNRLILKCIEKEPIKRYQNVKELLIDLNGIKRDSDYEVITNNPDDDHTIVMSPIKIKNTTVENEEKEEEEEFEEDEKKPLSTGKKVALMITAVILTVAIGLSAGYFINKFWNTNTNKATTNSDVKVPKIVGLTEADAKAKLTAAGLSYVNAGSNPDSSIAKDSVLKCLPTEDTPVKKGSEVRVILSSGPNTVKLDDFSNQDVNYAKQVITNNGLQTPEIKHENSDTVPVNNVIRQTPEPGSSVDSNTKITLVVSDGAAVKYNPVPDVTGKTADVAQQMLKNKSFNTSIVYKQTDKAEDAGKVAEQSVPANTQAVQNSTVIITVWQLAP